MDEYPFSQLDEAEEAKLREAREQLEARDEPWPPPLPETADDDLEKRFSLSHLMIVVGAASFVMLGFRLLPAGLFALGLGLVLLISRITIDVRGIDAALVHLIWWTLGLLYLIAIVAALQA